MSKKKSLFKYSVICAILICICIFLFILIRAPERIQRAHSTDIPLDYQYLTETITFPLSEPYLTREQVEDDLDELEWILENCY